MFGHCDVTSYFWCIYLITFPQCLGFCAIPSRHLLPYKFVLYLLLTFFSYWFSFNITIIFQEYVWPLCHPLLNVKHNFSKFADIFTNLTFFHLLYASCIFPSELFSHNDICDLCMVWPTMSQLFHLGGH